MRGVFTSIPLFYCANIVFLGELHRSSSFSLVENERGGSVGGETADFLALVAVPSRAEFRASKRDSGVLRVRPSLEGGFFFRRGGTFRCFLFSNDSPSF